VPFAARLSLDPSSGPPGTTVHVTATGFAAFEQATLTFIDSTNGKTVLGTFRTSANGTLTHNVTVPLDSTLGAQKVTAVGAVSHQKAEAKFTVT
jgi:hypothetical protein